MKAELILLLRNHIRVGAKQRQKVSSPKQSVTWQEWHVLARSWKSIGGPDVSSSESWERYIQEVELEMPVLADKLVRLDFGYKATLYRRLRSDKRWCP